MSPESFVRLERNVRGEHIRGRLKPKELVVLSFVARGYKNKQIADEMKTSEQVIKNHLSSIFDKTGTSDRLELVLFTIHNSILAPDMTMHHIHPA
jgi:DNA-binding NarL/FixJ family response regulator